jgi:hypothetical protein
MKTRKMIVPRRIIKRHLPHPEFYGESIVELDNGMTTDVYTDLEGCLYTETNNQKLIKYLSSITINEEPTLIKTNHLKLKSISRVDAKQIQEWFLISPFRRAQSVENEMDIVYEYISHAKSMYSDVFIISSNDKPIGLIGYTIIDQTGILNCDIYHQSDITTNEMNSIFDHLKKHLLDRCNLDRLLLHVFDFDGFMQEVIEQSMFTKREGLPILIPTLSGSMLQLVYEYTIEKA